MAYTIVGLLIIPFALFGVYNYFTGGSNPTVASVNGAKITRAELSTAVQRQRAQLRAVLGEQYNPAMFDDGGLRGQVLDRMINQAVLLQFVRSHGFRITDEALRSFIRSQPIFHVNGRFSSERYRRVLRQNGYSAAQYEAQLRQQLLLQQLQRSIAATAVITKHDVAQFVALKRQARNLAWLRVDSADFRDQIQVSDKAIQHYYATHKQAFKQPAKVKISYIVLSKETLASRVELGEEALRRFYEEVKADRFTIPGARHVRHILIELPQNASKQQVKAARKQIKALRQNIIQGADFAAVARRHSDDLGSARQGGDLGFVRRGDLVEVVAKAAFNLQVGELSEPIRSRFGWHLIKVTAIRPAKVKPFSEVKDQIRQELLEQQLAKRFYELSNQVANYAYEHPVSLKPVANKYGLKIQQSGWFSRSGAAEGIAAYPSVVEAAFSDDVLKRGFNSSSIKLDDGRRIILRVDDYKPASVPPLAEVRDRIRKRLIASRASEQAQELGAKLLEKTKAGHALEPLAKGDRIQYSAAGWVQRGSNKVPAAILEQGFRLPYPSGDKSSVAGFKLPDGDYVVLALRGVRDGELSKLNEAERQRVRQALQRRASEHTQQAMIHVLRQQADVTLARGVSSAVGGGS